VPLPLGHRRNGRRAHGCHRITLPHHPRDATA
jgi:hypothetical protein